MTLVTLLAVNTMINGIKAEMPRVRYLQNPCIRIYIALSQVTYITMSDAWLYPITYYCCFCLFEFLIIQVQRTTWHHLIINLPHTVPGREGYGVGSQVDGALV